MMGGDAIDYILAEALGKSLGEIRALPALEIAEWRAFYQVRGELEKLHRGRR